MKKLKLQLETLAVESFTADRADGQAGTVQAHELFATRPEVCDPFSLPPRCS
ncbi:hypothetical protein [Longimicrobium sp.]|uniref:hypothetical protein n=1 Tax=Longimicrobium sp. TaxID=2029185 RepID=UPI003B3B49CE